MADSCQYISLRSKICHHDDELTFRFINQFQKTLLQFKVSDRFLHIYQEQVIFLLRGFSLFQKPGNDLRVTDPDHVVKIDSALRISEVFLILNVDPSEDHDPTVKNEILGVIFCFSVVRHDDIRVFFQSSVQVASICLETISVQISVTEQAQRLYLNPFP